MFDWSKFISPKPSLDVPALETVDLNDKEMEKRIVRKQDLRIMPWVCITYLLSMCTQTPLLSVSNTHKTISTESTLVMPELSTMTHQSTTSLPNLTSPVKNTTLQSLSFSCHMFLWSFPATFSSSTFRPVNGSPESWCLGVSSPSAPLLFRHMVDCWL